ncbi:MAG TPA: alanine dehydrogenase, partial [Nitrospiria bacterium]|nr:alanine dehydrogenase [Nitrospiria bacterium]
MAVPREIKDHEYRVALTPDGVKRIVQGGHRVLVEKDAGKGCGFPVAAYRDAGGEILDDRKRLFGEAELVVKVKEPQPDEYPLFRRGQTLFAFLHLAADRPLTQALQKRGVTAIAYETVGSAEEGLPLLKPMSEIAGRMSPLMGAYYLQMAYGGSGVLVPGASEAPPARVVILGAGTVGGNAAEVSLGMGGDVTLFYRGGDR